MNIFRPGMKVTLVDDDFRCVDFWEKLGVNYPEKNFVYTIRDVFNDFDGALVVLLTEISNSIVVDALGEHYEPPFFAARFRPVVERKTDIAIFKAMLTRPRLGVRA